MRRKSIGQPVYTSNKTIHESKDIRNSKSINMKM